MGVCLHVAHIDVFNKQDLQFKYDHGIDIIKKEKKSVIEKLRFLLNQLLPFLSLIFMQA